MVFDMDESNKERQENELLALESIYSEKQFVLSPEKKGGTFFAHLLLPDDFKIAYPAFKNENEGHTTIPSDEVAPCEEISIHFLPPIVLDFELPEGYPSDESPCFTLSCKWLTGLQLSKLCQCLDDIWNEQGPGMEVLFEWMQFLSDDTLSHLKISSPLLLSHISLGYLRQSSSDKQNNKYDMRAVQDVASIDILVNFLTQYDSRESVEQFNSTYISCGICFSEKLGSQCVQFPKCQHVYCAECVTNYFIVQIHDGSVRALNCPEEKCDSQADPSMVKKLVPPEEYEQYEKFLLQSTLDCMDDMTYCPRQACQSVVLMEPDSKNMGRCPLCNFVFCVFCKRTYHGISHCEIKNKELLSLRDDYMNGSEEIRAALEKKYGRQRLQYIVEEYYSEAWIEKFAKNCPLCKTSIEKIDGCNKMACTKCRCYFCWLCGKSINSANPYFHFNDPNSPCFNKLFLGVESDDDGWFDDDFF